MADYLSISKRVCNSDGHTEGLSLVPAEGARSTNLLRFTCFAKEWASQSSGSVSQSVGPSKPSDFHSVPRRSWFSRRDGDGHGEGADSQKLMRNRVRRCRRGSLFPQQYSSEPAVEPRLLSLLALNRLLYSPVDAAPSSSTLPQPCPPLRASHPAVVAGRFIGSGEGSLIKKVWTKAEDLKKGPMTALRWTLGKMSWHHMGDDPSPPAGFVSPPDGWTPPLQAVDLSERIPVGASSVEIQEYQGGHCGPSLTSSASSSSIPL